MGGGEGVPTFVTLYESRSEIVILRGREWRTQRAISVKIVLQLIAEIVVWVLVISLFRGIKT